LSNCGAGRRYRVANDEHEHRPCLWRYMDVARRCNQFTHTLPNATRPHLDVSATGTSWPTSATQADVSQSLRRSGAAIARRNVRTSPRGCSRVGGWCHRWRGDWHNLGRGLATSDSALGARRSDDVARYSASGACREGPSHNLGGRTRLDSVRRLLPEHPRNASTSMWTH